jgi:hypothetical protein
MSQLGYAMVPLFRARAPLFQPLGQLLISFYDALQRDKVLTWSYRILGYSFKASATRHHYRLPSRLLRKNRHCVSAHTFSDHHLHPELFIIRVRNSGGNTCSVPKFSFQGPETMKLTIALARTLATPLATPAVAASQIIQVIDAALSLRLLRHCQR